VSVDHTPIYRWVQRYAPEIEKRLRCYWRQPSDLCPWHIDETYVKVNGGWACLYRALDSRGYPLDFYLSPRRHTQAALRLLRKILNNVKKWPITQCINTDKAPTYSRALSILLGQPNWNVEALRNELRSYSLHHLENGNGGKRNNLFFDSRLTGSISRLKLKVFSAGLAGWR